MGLPSVARVLFCWTEFIYKNPNKTMVYEQQVSADRHGCQRGITPFSLQ
jgi:hypothetical protein